MIRRQVEEENWLIAQDDHARVAGLLAGQARQINPTIPVPSSAAAIQGIAMHDSGWPIHDDQPTLNPVRSPLDVFETPPPIAMEVWSASANRAAKLDPYSGLLVSLHSLSLSIFATNQTMHQTSAWSLSRPRLRFEVNRFQHEMIELQETLRRSIGMRTDLPLEHGLARNSNDPMEKRLISDFRWLQGMDQLSLAICCTQPPFKKLSPINLEVTRVGQRDLHLSPWPFDQPVVEVQIPFKRLPARQWPDEREFRAVYQAAAVERFTVAIRQNRM